MDRAAENFDLHLAPAWRTKVAKLSLSVWKIHASVDLERRDRTPLRNEVAARIERAVGEHAVEDFVTPPSVTYAKGVGDFVFSHFICPERGRVVMHTSSVSSDRTRVGVALFGSLDNVPGWVGSHDPHPVGWTSSSMWDVLTWLHSRGQTTWLHEYSETYDPEYLAVEALKIATHQGMNDRWPSQDKRPWTRGFTFAGTHEAEWLAEVYHDVVLEKGRWDDTHVDRIVFGRPLWIRTPLGALERYRDVRRHINQHDA